MKRVEKVQPVKENLGAAKEVSCILKLLPSHKGSKVVTTVILLLIIIFLLLLLILLLLLLLIIIIIIVIIIIIIIADMQLTSLWLSSST